jgi:tight adherence protein C
MGALVLIAGLALTAIAVGCLASALALPRLRALNTLSSIEEYGFTGVPRGARAQAQTNGLFDGIAGNVGEAAASRVRALDPAALRQRLVAAGLYRTSPYTLLGYQVFLALGLPAGWLVLLSPHGAIAVLIAVLLAVLGWRLPLFVISRRGAQRLVEIDRQLPELIDLVVVTVEAGVGFSGSLRIASERLGGPLGDELRIAMQEQRMGLTAAEAITNMLARAETPAMRSFVRAVVQGEALGASIADIMRNLAIEMRKRRRAHAEERAQKAPVKLLFPLVFLIFPAMFIVLLGPALILVKQLFS